MERVVIPLCSTLFSLLLFMLISKSAANLCWEVEKSVDMTEYPDVEVGSPFALNCTLHNESIYLDGKKHYVNASYIIFKKGDNSIKHGEKIVISPLIAQLRVNVSKVDDTGTYNCILKLPEKNYVICGSKVTVGYKPTPPINFSCIIYDYNKRLQCKWWTEPNSVTTSSKIERILHTDLNIFSPSKCPHKEYNSSNHWVCEWTKSSVPSYNQFTLNYDFLVISNNSLGSRNDTFQVHRNEIILPDQPRLLTYQNLHPTSLKLEWKFPTGMNEFVPYLIYQLVYCKTNENFSKDIKVINVTSKKEHIFYYITNLIPHTQYKFELRCRSNVSKGENMWSKNATWVIQTKEDIPYTVPEITKEAFEIQQSKDNYGITLYWKPVPEEFQNGKNFYYTVFYTPLNVSYEQNNTVLYNRLNSSYTNITFNNLNSSTSYEFRIHSVNNAGISKEFATIVVNKLDNLLPAPMDITVISYDQNYFNVSWKPVRQMESPSKGYTVFWCTGDFNLLSKPLCNGSIHWNHTSADTTSIMHTMPKPNVKFGVAASSEYSSSGMVWASCMISYDDTIVKIREPFSVTAKNFSTIYIAWSFDCNAQKALIRNFDIIYCQTKDESSSCIEKEHTLTLKNKSEEHYYITGLAPKTYYRVFIRINSINNKMVESSYQFVQTPSEGTSTVMIVSIFIGVSFTCIFLTLIIYYLVKWMKKKFDVTRKITIKLPKGLDNDLLGSYENFKRGLLQQNTSLPPLKPRPGSFILDNNKNRCIATLSNSSAEELLYKNIDRCNTYWRNPSGDSSSGCSSNGIHDSISSSNTNHTHLSTDSGAELDISPLNTVDNVFCDLNLILKSKINSKSDMDIQDNKSSDSGLDKEISVEGGTKAKTEQPISTVTFVSPLNNQLFQHPYSKFGLNGPNSHYSKQWNNILTINYNLCNSEPSIISINENFNNGNKSLASLPYCKVGISRSSESIDGFHKDNREKENFADDANKGKDSGISPYVRSSLQYKSHGLNDILKPYISMGSYFENVLKVPNCKEDTSMNLKGNDDSMAYSKFDIQPSIDVVSSQVNPYIPVQQAHSMMQGVILPEINLNPSFDINVLNFDNSLLPEEFSPPDVNLGEGHLNTNEDFCSSTENFTDKSTYAYGCEKSVCSGTKDSEDDPKRQKSDITDSENLQTRDCYVEEPYKKFKYLNRSGTIPEGSNFEIIMAPQQLEQLDCALTYVSPFKLEDSSDEVDVTSNDNGYVHLPAVYYV